MPETQPPGNPGKGKKRVDGSDVKSIKALVVRTYMMEVMELLSGESPGSWEVRPGALTYVRAVYYCQE